MARITLSRENFFFNLDAIVEKTQDIKKVALVLKDNAYGHGLCEIAKLAKEYGITKAVVRSLDEACEIEDFFEYVLVLADTPKSPSEKIRYTINDATNIKNFPKNTLVELKVNTGMNRNGIDISQLDEVLELIQTQGLKLEAVFTHHSCADEVSNKYKVQKAAFEAVKINLKEKLPSLHFHSCNSAALFREENFSEDMVRVGIAAYGCLELASEIVPAFTLKPVLSLYANQLSSRNICEGEHVGYSSTFTASKELTISNYDFGYADGFLRTCSNSYETPEGVKIVGRISMDNSSFISEQKELLIFSNASRAAEYAKTISYEVLTSLKPHIKREIL